MPNQKIKLLRVVDANYNRAKEGMRVVEDIFRFVKEDDTLRLAARAIRHGVTKCIGNELLLDAIQTRDSRLDLGRKTDILELLRKDIQSILAANLQRAKEALRVLEECLKIISPKDVSGMKRLRYKLYDVEKAIFTSLKNSKRSSKP